MARQRVEVRMCIQWFVAMDGHAHAVHEGTCLACMYVTPAHAVDFESASSVHFGFSRATGRLAMNVFIIHNDDVLEDDEVFFGTFSIPPLVNAIQGKPNLTSIVIRDDDGKSHVTLLHLCTNTL